MLDDGNELLRFEHLAMHMYTIDSPISIVSMTRFPSLFIRLTLVYV